MALNVKVSKARYRGDPGIFGDIGRFVTGAIGTVAPGPIGAAARLANRLLQPKAKVTGTSASGTVARTASQPPMPAVPSASPGGVARPVTGPGVRLGMPVAISPMAQEPVPGIRGAVQRLLPGGETGYMETTMDGIPQKRYTMLRPAAVPISQPRPRGYRPNRSTYITQDGTLHRKGEWWVKSRRTNPFNPKALAKAGSRLKQYNTAKKKLADIRVYDRKCK